MGSTYAKAVVDGVLTGGVYALMAAGLTLIFGVMDIINIAQGIMVILGAYLTYALSVHLGMDLFATLIITIPSLFIVGVAVEWIFMRRLADRDRTAMSILVTYAVAILIEGIITQVFGVSYVQLHASYVDKSIHVFGFYLPYIYLYGFALAIILLAQLMVVLDATIVNIALPKIQTALSFSRTDLSWVLNAYSLTFGGLAPRALMMKRSSNAPNL